MSDADGMTAQAQKAKIAKSEDRKGRSQRGGMQKGKGHLSIGPSEAPGLCIRSCLLGSCTDVDSAQPIFQRSPVSSHIGVNTNRSSYERERPGWRGRSPGKNSREQQKQQESEKEEKGDNFERRKTKRKDRNTKKKQERKQHKSKRSSKTWTGRRRQVRRGRGRTKEIEAVLSGCTAA